MPHILIIDDDPAVLSLFGQFIARAGFSVALASTGLEGLRLMKQQLPALIITDILMPEMDGLELLRAVRADHPQLPVIAISGGIRNASVDFVSTAQQFGIGHVIEKPVSLTQLLATIKQLLPAET